MLSAHKLTFITLSASFFPKTFPILTTSCPLSFSIMSITHPKPSPQISAYAQKVPFSLSACRTSKLSLKFVVSPAFIVVFETITS